MTGPARFITLAPGITIPTAAAWLAVDLEARGLNLILDGDDAAVVGAIERLTHEDRHAISRYRPDLARLVRYVERGEASQ